MDPAAHSRLRRHGGGLHGRAVRADPRRDRNHRACRLPLADVVSAKGESRVVSSAPGPGGARAGAGIPRRDRRSPGARDRGEHLHHRQDHGALLVPRRRRRDATGARRGAGERPAGAPVQAHRVTPRGVVARRARQVRLLATDVDGVLTDGRMVLSERGDELKSFNSREGRAGGAARECGVDSARAGRVGRHRGGLHHRARWPPTAGALRVETDVMVDRVAEAAGPAHVVIRPSTGWTGVSLRDLWAYRELLYFLAWRDIKVRYKQTALGVIWVVIQPLFAMLVFSVFFGRLAGMPSGGVPYPVFAFCALLPWQLFAHALTESSASLVTNQNLITKVYFPRLIIPLAPGRASLHRGQRDDQARKVDLGDQVLVGRDSRSIRSGHGRRAAKEAARRT